MINSVRNTVLAILNKNNYGYLSPSDFNLFAKQAQLDLFEDYFYQYNYQLSKENARQSGTGYADIKKGYEEVIDIFSVTDFLIHDSANSFFTPSPLTTGNDFYLLNKILCYTRLLASGNNTAIVSNELQDAGATFSSAGVQIGDIVSNTSTNKIAIVTSVTNNNLGLPANIFTATPEPYVVYDDAVVNEAEKVTNSKITMLNNSMLTAPSDLFPAYTHQANKLTIFPATINNMGAVQCQYIRYPKPPKWTFVSLTGGEPVFDDSQSDYQDFELTKDDEPSLVMKILQFAGMSIREIQVVQFGQAQEQLENQNEK